MPAAKDAAGDLFSPPQSIRNVGLQVVGKDGATRVNQVRYGLGPGALLGRSWHVENRNDDRTMPRSVYCRLKPGYV